MTKANDFFPTHKPMEVIMTKTKKGLFFTAGTALATAFTFSRSSGGGCFMNMTAKRVFLIGLLVMLAAGGAFAKVDNLKYTFDDGGMSGLKIDSVTTSIGEATGIKVTYSASEAYGTVKFTFSGYTTTMARDLKKRSPEEEYIYTTWTNKEYITKPRSKSSWNWPMSVLQYGTTLKIKAEKVK